MKKMLCVMSTVLCVGVMHAQDLQSIKLVAPDKEGGMSLQKAFALRHSERAFAATPLKAEHLSTLLWSANGVNRSDGRRTAPSAMNVQDVDIYVLRSEGAYRYEAGSHVLEPLAAGDYRSLAAGSQAFVQEAPVILVLTSDLSRLSRGREVDEQVRLMGAMDVGIVCENINVACAGLGLATVPRVTMDKEPLRKVLQLKDTQILLINNPVGYPK